MSTLTRERLYNLLPALYRIRDTHRGEPLRALLAIIEGELQRLEHDIEGLYDNWFIESCDEWVVPYIGDLLGVRALHPVGNTGTYSHRAYVANTLAYRRRKGTAPVLEQLARDVTGWPARVVEFFQLLGTTQHMNHLRLANLRTPDLRHTNQLELLGGPFEQAAHTAEVRRIASQRGTYNIANIGLFLWRLQSYAVTRSTARRADPLDNRRYTFHPLGYDTPLFNQPQAETEITHLAAEINVPGVLRRRPLYDELEARRQALIAGATPTPLYFGNQPVLDVFMDPLAESLPPEELVICNLDAWDAAGWQPPQSQTFSLPDGKTCQTRVAVDPVLGRLAILADVPPPDAPPEVSYAYGFSGDVGGGPYNRQEAVSAVLDRQVTWHVGVSASLTADDDAQGLYTTLAAAVARWNQQPAGTVGVMAIMDSRSYSHVPPANLPQIDMPQGSLLLIVAADWPEVEVTDASGRTERRIGHIVPGGRHPHVYGDITVRGVAAGNGLEPGRLVLDGLRIEGRLNIVAGNLGALRVSHCTLVPRLGEVSLQVHRANERLKLTMLRSISGPISLPDARLELSLADSIVDQAGNVTAIDASNADTTVQSSTVFGPTEVRSLEASNSIFTGAVHVARRQIGCVRFSSVPVGSRTPRRYQCQPDLALTDITDTSERARIVAQLIPAFTSTRYGHPAYAQLSLACADELRTGAEDGAEMGAFSHLKQPQREANLRATLNEHLRFGFAAGIFYVT